ncbi:MAG TPA: alkaline phosphatase family protein [Candidatus Binatus sp.]|nr:alkaline phosphatase family protein [Candidatus Binatus sp.]
MPELERPGPPPSSSISRRRFIEGAAAAAGALALGSVPWPRSALAQAAALPSPGTSGIEHVVLVMMENRSFDHFLGWLPGADGRQAGLTYLDRAGMPHMTHPLAPDYQGCGHPDPDHSYEGGRIEYDGGACDGWLRAGNNDDYAIGYYTRSDLAFLGRAVPRWSTGDRYFAAIMAETFPNRIYQHAAQTDRIHNSFDPSTLPTIWDRLAEAGVDGRYYYSDTPFLALWGPKYVPISRPFATFLADAAAGTLPQVAFVDPRFQDEESGTSGDDHPHADIRNGEAFMNQVYSAVTRSPAWRNTVLVFNYDEWGGFFDHVPPPTAPIPPADQAAGNQDGLLGFRVPLLVVSPFVRRRYVSHTVFDHTSLLRMIEWRWGLAPLTVRDATANNLALLLDFTRPRLRAPAYVVPPGPFGAPCAPAPLTPHADKWDALRALALASGWPL